MENGKHTEGRVALISMPFSTENALPNLAISQLKACLNKQGIDCDNYYFDEQIKDWTGWSVYFLLSTLHFIGEWFFSSTLFEDHETQPPLNGEIYRSHGYSFDPGVFREQLIETHQQASQMMDELFFQVPWNQYRLIGFSTTFFQTIASLSLAKRIKTNYPEIAIILGGSNCDGEKGMEIHRQFPFVDFVLRGDGEETFPVFTRRFLAGNDFKDIPGMIYRSDSGRSIGIGERSPTIMDLDRIPFPDFSDYVRRFPLDNLADFPIQFSRGCWWGEKTHCIFCGMNGADLSFRSKSPSRILKELDFLSRQYQQTQFYVVDNILKPSFFANLFPKIIEENRGWSFFFEVKANMRKGEVEQLRKANVRYIQPGIESFSDQALQIMNKGCSGIQNVQLLKWCSEYGVIPVWNWIYGIPGEDVSEFQRLKTIIKDLVHLKPPKSLLQVRLDRFSVMFDHPDQFGICNVAPAEEYRSIYPFDEEVISRLANVFSFDYQDGRDPKEYAGEFLEELRLWRKNYAPGSLSSLVIDDKLFIYDNRPYKERKRYMLEGLRKDLYEYCDIAHSFQGICRNISPAGIQGDHAEIRKILDKMVSLGLMYSDQDSYLSLAVSRTEQARLLSNNPVVQEAFVEAISEIYQEVQPF